VKTDYVADTMAVILRLEKRRLPGSVKEIFEQAENGLLSLAVPAMSVAELAYLSERRRIEATLPELFKYVRQHERCSISAMTGHVVEQAFLIPDIPELHDRLIAATALCLSAVLITNDPVIASSRHVQTIW